MDHPDDPIDRQFMAEALRLAARIPRRPWPNPPVGALVVREGIVVGRGAHHGAGTAHAEVVALREAGDLARGATLYCTLEPCNHEGRTPPCAPAVAAAGVRRVVAGVADPNRNVRGGGLRQLRDAGLETRCGVMAEEALDLIWPFAGSQAFQRPFVILKTATSLDGCFAPAEAARPSAAPFYLTGTDARRDVHCLRKWCDVVLVGRQTMVADAPRLDARLAGPDADCPAEDPCPAFVDTRGDLGAGWSRPYWVFTGKREAGAGGPPLRTLVPCEQHDGRVDPRSLLAEFHARGGHVLLVEGGPSLAASFLGHDVVDRWVSYTAPALLGAGIRWSATTPACSFHLTRVERRGDDVKAVYDRLSFHGALASLAGGQGVL